MTESPQDQLRAVLGSRLVQVLAVIALLLGIALEVVNLYTATFIAMKAREDAKGAEGQNAGIARPKNDNAATVPKIPEIEALVQKRIRESAAAANTPPPKDVGLEEYLNMKRRERAAHPDAK